MTSLERCWSGTTRSHSVMATASEIKKIIDDALNPMKSDIAKLLKLEKKINAQEKLIKSLEKRVELVESLEKRVEALEPLQERVDILESQLKVLESLDRRINEVEQYGRRMCLRFNNIEVSQDGRKEDCVKTINDIMKETKCGVRKQAIDRAHRIGPRKTGKDGITTQQIIVRFNSFTERTKVYRNRRKITSNVKVSLDLTKSRLRILLDAQALAAQNSDVLDFVFADINCSLTAKLRNGKFVFFNSFQMLQKKIAEILEESNADNGEDPVDDDE